MNEPITERRETPPTPPPSTAVYEGGGCSYILAYCLLLWMWIGGAVLAKGAWLTTLAIFMPPYAMYLVIERVMIVTGFI
jgi:hypothetical protein